MNKEYTKLISFILVLTFVLSGVIYIISDKIKENKQNIIREEQIIIDEISNVYTAYKRKVEEFSAKRDKVNDEIAEYVSFYDNMQKSYDKMKDTIKEYETNLQELEDASEFLKSKCLGDRYSSTDANEKCNAYIINYETAVNMFASDIEILNDKVDNYNEWIKEKTGYKQIEHFSVKYGYLDLNGDGTYLGENNG